jgi:hypothetical protein
VHHVTLGIDGRDLQYEDVPFLSGWQHSLTADIRYAITPASNITAGLSYVRDSAVERAYAFSGNSASVRYVQEWTRGWIGSVFYQYTTYDFDAVDPFFGVVRADRETRAELGIANRYLSYKGLAPRITLGTQTRKSNLDLYSFNSAYVRVGVVTEF